MKHKEYSGLEIAVIGMACRFPKSHNIQAFWDNLKAGKECITIEKGDDASGLIKAKGILEENECFDFDFFNYAPNEAELLDPQIRVLHECTWEALEDAGCNPLTYGGLIGNYVGASTNPTADLNPFLRKRSNGHELWSSLLYSDKDFISTRISHKLNLRGPSITLDTACSTSLTAIDLACQSLLTGKCDMAVAGGASITYHDENGYVYKDGFISSPDGHCRAFDEDAKGTVTGNGVGVVILKRLDDALKDGDKIDAVILGSAVNNDGITKQGYTAPSREGQVAVIRSAQQMAGISPETVGYIEAHGTGTQIGDPVEIDALKIAFNTNKRNYCAIGSVKTNLGHLDAAAGIAGFIKAVLVLKNKLIPATLHFKKPNSKFDLNNSPFYINNTLVSWVDDQPLKRAGVSSFGIGGTNIHVVLEEAPTLSFKGDAEHDVFLLSARTREQLEELKNKFAAYINSEAAEANAFNNIAHTLKTGRQHFKHKFAVHAESLNDLTKKLQNGKLIGESGKKPIGKTVFMFSGQGSQYLNMTRQLYAYNPFYQAQLDQCFGILNSIYSRDIKSILFQDDEHDAAEINNTLYTQPILVAVEYALAKLLIHCGIHPDMVIGHSVGEYTAACVAGVFSLRDTLALVSKRAQLMNNLEKGCMLAVNAEKEELLGILPKGVSLAAENSDRHMVLSGSFQALTDFKETLLQHQWPCMELHTSHAFHSDMMLPIKEALEKEIGKFTMNSPSYSYISNLTGKVVDFEEIRKPSYWGEQMMCTVLFKESIRTAAQAGANQFLEIGPGIALQTFTKSIIKGVDTTGFVRHIKETTNDIEYFLGKLARLWERGNKINWYGASPVRLRGKVSLPSYPFAKNHIPIRRIDFNAITENGMPQQSSGEAMLRYYAPIWKQAVFIENQGDCTSAGILLFTFDVDKDAPLIDHMRKTDPGLLLIEIGDSSVENSANHQMIDAGSEEDYAKVIRQLEGRGNDEIKIIFCDDRAVEKSTKKPVAFVLQIFLMVIKSLTLSERFKRKNIYIITFNLQNVLNEAVVNTYSSTLLGALKVVSCEHEGIHCTAIDIDQNELADENSLLLDNLTDEIGHTPKDIIVSYRKNIRWVQDFQEIILNGADKRLKQGGVYMITGGVGGMACTIAAYLLERYDAHVVLIGRSEFLRDADWSSAAWIETVDVRYRKRLNDLVEKHQRSKGSLSSYQASISDSVGVHAIFLQVISGGRSIDGIFHTAGVVDYGGVMQRRSVDSFLEVMLPKVNGTDNLIECIKATDVRPDFLLLFSSNGNTFYAYKYGQAAYNAANEYMDTVASAQRLKYTDIKAINWNDWYDVGMTVDSLEHKFGNLTRDDFYAKIDDGITPVEGLAVIENVLSSRLTRVVVSRKDVKREIARMNDMLQNNRSALWSGLLAHSSSENRVYKRPELDTEYLSPRTNIEERIINELANYLKYENIGVYDNFFELGLTSLDLVQISSRLSKTLQSEINVTTLFTYPTVDMLANKLGFIADEELAPQATVHSNADDLQNSLELFN